MYARGDPPRRTLLDRSGRMLFAGVWRLMDWNLHRSKKGVDILRSISSNHPRRHVTRIFRICADLQEIPIRDDRRR